VKVDPAGAGGRGGAALAAMVVELTGICPVNVTTTAADRRLRGSVSF
jgi:hypothetical protein